MIQDAPEFYSWKDNLNVRYFGLHAAQNIYAFPAFSLMLDVEQPARIVELGCGVGGLTLYIGLWAKLSGKKVYAYDQEDARQFRELWDMLEIQFCRTNFYDRQTEIGQIISSEGKTILMCDGGDKIREVQTFSQYLKPGDIVMAHDYNATGEKIWWGWCEITKPVFEGGGLEPVYERLLETAAWGAFRRL